MAQQQKGEHWEWEVEHEEGVEDMKKDNMEVISIWGLEVECQNANKVDNIKFLVVTDNLMLTLSIFTSVAVCHPRLLKILVTSWSEQWCFMKWAWLGYMGWGDGDREHEEREYEDDWGDEELEGELGDKGGEGGVDGKGEVVLPFVSVPKSHLCSEYMRA
jgi:hypothetical protein